MSELLGANTEVLERISESLNVDARRMQEIRALAQRAVAELHAGWNGPDLLALTQQWEQQASQRLGDASASLEVCAAGLRAQSGAQRGTSSEGGSGAGPVLVGTALTSTLMATLAPAPTPAPPPAHGSPTDSAAWWRSLSSQQQQRVVEQHPDWVGNRDGVPFGARDEANRARLSTDRARLLAEKSRLEADLADNGFGGTFTNDDAALARVKDQLASISAIDETLAKTGDRQLLLLDLSADRAQAAIARGNVDTADNVAVFVPGLSANVIGGMVGWDNNMDQLQRRTELESKRANANQSAATVTWIGYQAPQMGWDLLGRNSVVDDEAARNGAAQLVPFLQGIGATRDQDAHLTLLGHSYGSTTAGLALRQDTGVDDAVFFGSPGLGTTQLDDLRVGAGHTDAGHTDAGHISAGHIYYVEARQDAVGDLGLFGSDPSHMIGIEHASAKASAVVDPLTGEIRHFSEVTGHSSYLLDDSTSQYNMSVVAAGLPDRRVYDGGTGFGDILSRPILGTLR